MKKILYQILYPIALIYWKIFKPKTFGVKGIITRQKDNNREVLLIKHSYGLKKDHWNIPGGGYNPDKEKPINAVIREIKEELNLNIHNWEEIGEYKTEAEGKRDTVIIFHTNIDNSSNISLSDELNKAKWFNIDKLDYKEVKLTKLTKYAIKLLTNH